jgi:hypothetical protein
MPVLHNCRWSTQGRTKLDSADGGQPFGNFKKTVNSRLIPDDYCHCRVFIGERGVICE